MHGPSLILMHGELSSCFFPPSLLPWLQCEPNSCQGTRKRTTGKWLKENKSGLCTDHGTGNIQVKETGMHATEPAVLFTPEKATKRAAGSGEGQPLGREQTTKPCGPVTSSCNFHESLCWLPSVEQRNCIIISTPQGRIECCDAHFQLEIRHM